MPDEYVYRDGKMTREERGPDQQRATGPDQGEDKPLPVEEDYPASAWDASTDYGPRAEAPGPQPDHVADAYRKWLRTDEGAEMTKAMRDKALEARRLGVKRWGIQAIAELVRWDALIGSGVARFESYKVNNSHLALFARDLMAKYPDELGDLFETRARGQRS